MVIRELPELGEREEMLNKQIREQGRERSLQGHSTNSAIVEPKKKNNTTTLAEGEHGGARLTKPNTTIFGSNGSQMTKKVTVEDSVRFNNIHFKEQVEVTSNTATVMFLGCRFDTAKTPVVSLLSGTKAHFTACLFTNSPTGDVIDNPGGGATTVNVQVVGSSNVTGQSLGNVTQTAVTT